MKAGCRQVAGWLQDGCKMASGLNRVVGWDRIGLEGCRGCTNLLEVVRGKKNRSKRNVEVKCGSRKMKPPYLGKINLFWCRTCNVPVLGRVCGICERRTEEVPITPPGDVRPAFEEDIRLINRTTSKQFGTALIPDDRVVLLNSASGFDRFDEVIMDGKTLGVLKYDLKSQAFEFLPRLAGAGRLVLGKKVVEIDGSAVEYILKGASVLMPGVKSFDESIEEDEEVIVTSNGEVIAVGRSRLSGKAAKKQRRGIFVKCRRYGRVEETAIPAGGQTWDDVVRANRDIIDMYESEALRFIKEVSGEIRLPGAVAFSGGKDSLATLLLVKKVIDDVPLMFIDTGLEFPETVEHVKEIAEGYGLELLTERAGDGFWRGTEYFGPPGRDYRWCCKICKLGPTTRLISRHFRDGCLSFIGQRRYESEVRARSERVWRNPWVPSQVGASPIQNWSALHVWLYLMREGVMTNSLYGRGLERIGCWACPASDIAEFEVMRSTHRDLLDMWRETLEQSGISPEEQKYGFWRWRNPSGGQRRLASDLGLSTRRRNEKVFKYRVCDSRATGKFESFDFSDFGRAANLALIFGEVERGEEYFRVRGMTIYRNGEFEVNLGDAGDAGAAGDAGDEMERVRILFGIIERGKNCFGCGVCIGQCKSGAVEIREGRVFINGNCIRCEKCHRRCPIVRYGVNNARFVRVEDEKTRDP